MVKMSETAFDTDIFVVGGGPAGLAAALAVRKRGFSVTVADHATPPIDKACGEGLMPDSLAVLGELGVKLNDVETGTFQGIKFIRDNCEASAHFPYGIGHGIRRTALHQRMTESAAEAGVRLCWGTRVDLSRLGLLSANGKAVRARWIVGADGLGSRVRQWAGLNAGRERDRRIGFRQHFRVNSRSEFVEIYWTHGAQAYVTPVSANEICVAIISRRRCGSFVHELARFPFLNERLAGAQTTTMARGSLTLSRKLRSVFRGNVALIGEASGSVDAITGEGLAMAFRQALALADAIAAGDLSAYQRAHRQIGEVPDFMARSMLLMDKSNWIQRRAMTAFTRCPALFGSMLSVHVGATPLKNFGQHGIVNIGWQLLTV